MSDKSLIRNGFISMDPKEAFHNSEDIANIPLQDVITVWAY